MLKVGVFFGSRSVEHEISIITAQQAIAQLEADSTIQVIPVYISKEGALYTGPKFKHIENFKDIPKLLEQEQPVHLIRENNQVGLLSLSKKTLGGYRRVHNMQVLDIAFPILHGSFGEDGTLQGLFEQLQLPYVGCHTLAAAVTMDKIMTKLVLRSVGVSVIEDVWIHAEDFVANPEAWIDTIEHKLGYPVIVKPADTGSSIGVTPAHNREALTQALFSVRKFSHRILVEHMVQDMREINISVLGDAGGIQLSVCEEPISASEFLTFEDKYTQGDATKGMSSAKRQIPADLEPALRNQIEHFAALAFKALDCSGVCRIDYIIDRAANRVYLNEFNTIPGSLAFYLWEASGLAFPELLKQLIRLGFLKYEHDKKIVHTHTANLLGSFAGGLKGKGKA